MPNDPSQNIFLSKSTSVSMMSGYVFITDYESGNKKRYDRNVAGFLSGLNFLSAGPKTKDEVYQYLSQSYTLSDVKNIVGFWFEARLVKDHATEVLHFHDLRTAAKFVDYSNDLELAEKNKFVESIEQDDESFASKEEKLKIQLPHPLASSVYQNDQFPLGDLLFYAYGVLKEMSFYNHQATLRPVPSNGARHPFTLFVNLVGVPKGFYSYDSSCHELVLEERLADEGREEASALYISCDFDKIQKIYRTDWNYIDFLSDLGHLVGQIKILMGHYGFAYTESLQIPSHLKPILGLSSKIVWSVNLDQGIETQQGETHVK